MDALCGPDGVDDNREKGVVGQRIASGQQEAGRERKAPGRGDDPSQKAQPSVSSG